MNATSKTRCTHTIVEDNIHVFTMHEVSTVAVDEMMRHTDDILANTPFPQVHPSLVDTRIGIQPIGHAFYRMRELVKKYPKRNAGRFAMIVPDSPLLRVIDIFMRPFGGVRFFSVDQYDQAIEWLKQG